MTQYARYRRRVRVAFDATVEYDVPLTGNEADDAAVAEEAASVLALGFVGDAQMAHEFPFGKPVSTWVSAYGPSGGEFEGDVDLVLVDASYEIQDASQSAVLEG